MRRAMMLSGLSGATLVLASAMILAPCRVVMADDAGMRAFFRQESGQDLPVARPVYAVPETRPLVVRPHRRVVRLPEATKVAVAPTGPVSIYDDNTLRPGDAVMTAKGLRVFMGGHAAPYSEADFVALSNAEGLPRQVEKALVVIDKAQHG